MNTKQNIQKMCQEKTETFLRHFSSVFTIEPTDEMPNFEKRLYTDELNDIKITDNIVITKLNKLKTNKSPGPDKLHPRVLRDVSDVIAKPVTMILKNSKKTKSLE